MAVKGSNILRCVLFYYLMFQQLVFLLFHPLCVHQSQAVFEDMATTFVSKEAALEREIRALERELRELNVPVVGNNSSNNNNNIDINNGDDGDDQRSDVSILGRENLDHFLFKNVTNLDKNGGDRGCGDSNDNIDDSIQNPDEVNTNSGVIVEDSDNRVVVEENMSDTDDVRGHSEHLGGGIPGAIDKEYRMIHDEDSVAETFYDVPSPSIVEETQFISDTPKTGNGVDEDDPHYYESEDVIPASQEVDAPSLKTSDGGRRSDPKNDADDGVDGGGGQATVDVNGVAKAKTRREKKSEKRRENGNEERRVKRTRYDFGDVMNDGSDSDDLTQIDGEFVEKKGKGKGKNREVKADGDKSRDVPAGCDSGEKKREDERDHIVDAIKKKKREREKSPTI